MALTIDRLDKEGEVKGYTTDRRLYLDADGKVTDDPEKAAHLLAAAGRTIPEAQARELGLTGAADEPEPQDFSSANKDTLIAEAEARGLDTDGTKKELLFRIEGHDAAADKADSDG